MKYSLAISMCDPSHYLPLARAAEAAGWDSVCVPDGGPWTDATSEAYGTGGSRWWGPDTAFLDPFVVIPAMAAVTERIHFYTNVYKLPTRSPLHTARTVASAWALAPGRIALGIGLGWNREEYEALGVEFEHRGSRADEALEILREVLKGDWVEFHGRFHDLPRLKQAPSIPSGLPIYAGGDSEVALRRAARYCDGWIVRAPAVDDVIAAIPRMDAALAAAGRTRAGTGGKRFEILAMCPDATDEASLLRLAAAEVDDVALWPWNRDAVGLEDLEGKCEAVERFAREVIDPVRARGTQA